jgi:hypothetical protein
MRSKEMKEDMPHGYDDSISTTATSSTRADQSPPLPDEVSEAVLPIERFDYYIRWTSDTEGYVEMEASTDGGWVRYEDVEPLIRAATQQPEVVTVEEFKRSMMEWNDAEDSDFPLLEDWLMHQYPHGLKIVEG